MVAGATGGATVLDLAVAGIGVASPLKVVKYHSPANLGSLARSRDRRPGTSG